MNMQSSTSTSVPPWHTYYYPIPKHLFTQQNLHFPINKKLKKSSITNTQNTHYLTHTQIFPTLYAFTTNSCSKEQDQEETPNNNSYPNQQNPKIVADSWSSSKTQNTHLKEDTDESDCRSGISSNRMWWAGLKAALGQRINLEGLAFSVGIFLRDKHLVIPHVSVRDIRYIDWAELKRRGFEGVVFDKDNTLTIPYSLSLWGPLGTSIEQCKSLFGHNVAVFSNSAGLYEYDPDGKKAKALETAIGINVIRHRVKKPAGSAEEIERYFGCESPRIIMVGDRPFTDIVYGNRNGFLTILTEPLSVAEEPFIVKQVRIIEVALVNRWSRKGVKATSHQLFPHPEQCVKDQPL